MMMEWAWETCAIKLEERGRVARQMGAISHTPPVDSPEDDEGWERDMEERETEQRGKMRASLEAEGYHTQHKAVPKPHDHISHLSETDPGINK